MISSLIVALLLIAAWSYLARSVLTTVAFVILGFWFVFFLFCLNFFRDPEAKVPANPGVYVAPAHGTVDLVDEITEKTFIGGPCRRISIFLSVFDIHIQNAPIPGTVRYLKYCPGKFLNAMRKDCGLHNENVLIGFDSAEFKGERLAVRLIAGLIARRIVPWIKEGDVLTKGQRISLIQFGSRVDLYLPPSAKVTVTLGQKVKGGETIVAVRS
jgi:phosphatidylserine decarboxylase